MNVVFGFTLLPKVIPKQLHVEVVTSIDEVETPYVELTIADNMNNDNYKTSVVTACSNLVKEGKIIYTGNGRYKGKERSDPCT